jgi:hypothetical protein
VGECGPHNVAKGLAHSRKTRQVHLIFDDHQGSVPVSVGRILARVIYVETRKGDFQESDMAQAFGRNDVAKKEGGRIPRPWRMTLGFLVIVRTERVIYSIVSHDEPVMRKLPKGRRVGIWTAQTKRTGMPDLKKDLTVGKTSEVSELWIL